MNKRHPKYVRRRILIILYDCYMHNPLEMLGPDIFIDEQGMTRADLVPNIHYLADRGLVELMIGYNPALFASARIRPDGIDLVENRYAFNLRFPPAPGAEEEAVAEVPLLVEDLVNQAELSPLDGDGRRALLQDVAFLREEIARPVHRWRKEVVDTVLSWIAAPFTEPAHILPALPKLHQALDHAWDEEKTAQGENL